MSLLRTILGRSAVFYYDCHLQTVKMINFIYILAFKKFYFQLLFLSLVRITNSLALTSGNDRKLLESGLN